MLAGAQFPQDHNSKLLSILPTNQGLAGPEELSAHAVSRIRARSVGRLRACELGRLGERPERSHPTPWVSRWAILGNCSKEDPWRKAGEVLKNMEMFPLGAQYLTDF